MQALKAICGDLVKEFKGFSQPRKTKGKRKHKTPASPRAAASLNRASQTAFSLAHRFGELQHSDAIQSTTVQTPPPQSTSWPTFTNTDAFVDTNTLCGACNIQYSPCPSLDYPHSLRRMAIPFLIH